MAQKQEAIVVIPFEDPDPHSVSVFLEMLGAAAPKGGLKVTNMNASYEVAHSTGQLRLRVTPSFSGQNMDGTSRGDLITLVQDNFPGVLHRVNTSITGICDAHLEKLGDAYAFEVFDPYNPQVLLNTLAELRAKNQSLLGRNEELHTMNSLLEEDLARAQEMNDGLRGDITSLNEDQTDICMNYEERIEALQQRVHNLQLNYEILELLVDGVLKVRQGLGPDPFEYPLLPEISDTPPTPQQVAKESPAVSVAQEIATLPDFVASAIIEGIDGSPENFPERLSGHKDQGHKDQHPGNQYPVISRGFSTPYFRIDEKDPGPSGIVVSYLRMHPGVYTPRELIGCIKRENRSDHTRPPDLVYAITDLLESGVLEAVSKDGVPHVTLEASQRAMNPPKGNYR